MNARSESALAPLRALIFVAAAAALHLILASPAAAFEDYPVVRLVEGALIDALSIVSSGVDEERRRVRMTTDAARYPWDLGACVTLESIALVSDGPDTDSSFNARRRNLITAGSFTCDAAGNFTIQLRFDPFYEPPSPAGENVTITLRALAFAAAQVPFDQRRFPLRFVITALDGFHVSAVAPWVLAGTYWAAAVATAAAWPALQHPALAFVVPRAKFLQSLAVCDFSRSYTIDPLQYWLGAGVGGGPHQFFVAAIIVNTFIVLGVVMLHTAFAVARALCRFGATGLREIHESGKKIDGGNDGDGEIDDEASGRRDGQVSLFEHGRRLRRCVARILSTTSLPAPAIFPFCLFVQVIARCVVLSTIHQQENAAARVALPLLVATTWVPPIGAAAYLLLKARTMRPVRRRRAHSQPVPLPLPVTDGHHDTYHDNDEDEKDKPDVAGAHVELPQDAAPIAADSAKWERRFPVQYRVDSPEERARKPTLQRFLFGDAAWVPGFHFAEIGLAVAPPLMRNEQVLHRDGSATSACGGLAEGCSQLSHENGQHSPAATHGSAEPLSHPTRLLLLGKEAVETASDEQEDAVAASGVEHETHETRGGGLDASPPASLEPLRELFCPELHSRNSYPLFAWIATSAAFARHFGPLFVYLRRERRWFLLAELAFSVAIGSIEGSRSAPAHQHCTIVGAVALGASLLFTTALLVLAPYIAPVDHLSSVAGGVVMTLSCAFSIIFHQVGHSWAELVATALTCMWLAAHVAHIALLYVAKFWQLDGQAELRSLVQRGAALVEAVAERFRRWRGCDVRRRRASQETAPRDRGALEEPLLARSGDRGGAPARSEATTCDVAELVAPFPLNPIASLRRDAATCTSADDMDDGAAIAGAMGAPGGRRAPMAYRERTVVLVHELDEGGTPRRRLLEVPQPASSACGTPLGSESTCSCESHSSLSDSEVSVVVLGSSTDERWSDD